MNAYHPQLVMFLSSLSDLPPLQLHSGYSVRTYRPGDDTAWNGIIKASFQKEYDFAKHISERDAFKPERVLFVCHDDRPVATACAWHKSAWGEQTGYLHMVGVLPSYSGKKLGHIVSLAALQQMVKEGRKSAVLHTDDYRIPAIVTYLKLGFHPQMAHENHVQRWRQIAETLGNAEVLKLLPG
ncbi:GNAT family N-acetyltransferase [Paenibacillus sp. MBLB4367]|uniref:GNAT family N-acetyltransferase n=1 Tax=Paenibacillus sp. MBLB4367 TaxID=3384767 RepID=UPI0039080BBD